MISITATLTSTLQDAGHRRASLSFTVTDTDQYVTAVSCVVAWGDGQVETYDRQAKPIVVTNLEHIFSPGDYVVTVTGRNYKPVPETWTYSGKISVEYPNSPVVNQNPVIFGPVLPSGQNVPGKTQWSFNMANDSKVVESSIRMLLSTERGERLMTPDYGVSLRRFVFNPNTQDVDTEVKDEIASAVARWEPRATLQSISVKRSGRQATVSAVFSSVIDQTTFAVTQSLAP